MIKTFELNLVRTDFKCDSCGEWFSSVPRYEGKLLNLNLRLTPSEYIKSTCKACVAMCCSLAGNHVLLENIPLVKFIKTTSRTRVVYFP